jgi:hypothetical protein
MSILVIAKPTCSRLARMPQSVQQIPSFHFQPVLAAFAMGRENPEPGADYRQN